MIHFYREQVELAKKLIDIKSKRDDIKAQDDVTEIKSMIKTAIPTVEFVNAAKQLDKRINEEYPEIVGMHKAALNMTNFIKLRQEKAFSEYDAILSDLNSDVYGIYASVLLKHGKISCIKEFIERVD